MTSAGSISGLLSPLVGLLLGLMAWEIWKSRGRHTGSRAAGSQGDVLVWMLALAAFTLGAFLTYVLVQP